jgi:hypothetical protein
MYGPVSTNGGAVDEAVPRWAWAVGVLLLVLYTVKILAFDV